MHLCRALYGEAILVHRFGAPIWPPEINKNIWSPLFLQKLFLFTRELAYSRINISSTTWNGYTAENQEERFFLTRRHSYFGVTHCENLEVQIAVFSKWNMLREWKLVPRYFDFTIWRRHCENHLLILPVWWCWPTSSPVSFRFPSRGRGWMKVIIFVGVIWFIAEVIDIFQCRDVSRKSIRDKLGRKV